MLARSCGKDPPGAPASAQTRWGAGAGAGAIPGEATDAGKARPPQISAPDSPVSCLGDLEEDTGESPSPPPANPQMLAEEVGTLGWGLLGPSYPSAP